MAAMQGYGFLSENAAFVDICGDHGIEFIGPTSKHIAMMGDKSTARDTMAVRRNSMLNLSHVPGDQLYIHSATSLVSCTERLPSTSFCDVIPCGSQFPSLRDLVLLCPTS